MDDVLYREQRNDEIKKDYINDFPMSELVKIYGLHRSTIQSILKRLGVSLHRNRSFIVCNRKLFSEYTNSSCYWAGFILADGNIRKDRNSLQIKLAIKDKNHLDKFLNSISCNEFNKVKTYLNTKNPYVSLTISLDEFKRDLDRNFSITPNKTYIACVSHKIPRNILKHFIRGYIDGDGSITKTTVRALSIVGTVGVLTSIASFFKDIYNIKLKSKNDSPPICNLKNNVGAISYSGENAKKILDNLYSNISSEIVLDRKYSRYKELFVEDNDG